ncbi:MAG: response regulator [Deltaproteobacteria bacterium]|nr:response regulator [Deltaproteobacteria bacterium]
MKTLVVEDDFTSRLLLQEILKRYGDVHIAVNGTEAIEAVKVSLESMEPYNLICLDIMMPEMDGQQALEKIRKLEEDMKITADKWSKIIMTTALSDFSNIKTAFGSLCDAYLIKPIDVAKLKKTIEEAGLI